MAEHTANQPRNHIGDAFSSRRLAESLASHRIPGAGISVFHEGDTADFYAGLGNVSAGTRVSEETLFQVGSVTKIFTATLLLRLVEQGIVDLDAPVSHYLPELKIGHAPPPDAMTVRTLLDYSSGVEGQYFADFGSDADSLKRYVDACSDLRMIHAPGEVRAYNSTSYCLAGRLIELVTGRYFDDALAELLLRPVGISDYSFYEDDIPGPKLAVGHHWCTRRRRLVVDDQLRLPRAMSPAGASLSLSSRDLLAFALLHLDNGRLADGERYLSETLTEAMRTPRRTVPPNDSELLIGWAGIATTGGRMTIASGRTIGQNAFVLIIPEQRFAMSITANTATGGEQLFLSSGLDIVEKTTGATVDLPRTDAAPETASEPPDPAPYVGAYTNPNELRVFVRSGRLFAESTEAGRSAGTPAATPSRLVHIDAHRFALIPQGASAPAATAEFLFLDAGNGASHVASGGSVFGRRRT